MDEKEELMAKIRSLEEVIRRKEEELTQSGVNPGKCSEILLMDKELLLVYEKRLLVYEEQLATMKAASAARGAAGTGAGDDVKMIMVLQQKSFNSSFWMPLTVCITDQQDFEELLEGMQSAGLIRIPMEEEVAEELDVDDDELEELYNKVLVTGLPLRMDEVRRRFPTLQQLVRTFKGLEDSAFYVLEPCSRDTMRTIRQEIGHILQGYKDQLGKAALFYAKANREPGVECSLRHDLCVLKEPDGRPSMELDAVIFAGDDTAYIASHKLHITGPKPVKAIMEAAKLVTRCSEDPFYRNTGYAEFRGRKLVPVLAAEKVQPKSEVLVRKACGQDGVIQFKRNGRSFSVISMHTVRGVERVQHGHIGHARRAFSGI